MTIFSKMIEDPMYDEDGVMIDEDSDEGDWEDDDWSDAGIELPEEERFA